MNNKLVLNILIVYFLILCIVLGFQIARQQKKPDAPSNSVEITAENRLNDAIVLCKDSPIMLVNKRQQLLDAKDCSLVPEIKGEVMYVPLSFFESAFGANVSGSDKGETVIRLDSKALVMNYGTVRVVDSTEDKYIDSQYYCYNERATTYVPLTLFAQVFEKYLYYYDGMVIISSVKDSFGSETPEFIADLRTQVTGLPYISTKENLQELINISKDERKGNYHYPVRLLGSGYDRSYTTDGVRLYYISESGLSVINLENGGELVASKPFEKGFVPYSAYRSGDRVVFVGTITGASFDRSKENTVTEGVSETTTEAEKDVLFLDDPTDFADIQTVIYIYNASDLKHLRTVRLEGAVFDTSVYGESVYVVADAKADRKEISSPGFVDTYSGKGKESISFEKIKYFPELVGGDYTVCASVNIGDDTLSPVINAFWGAGSNKYLSGAHLYIAKDINCAVEGDIKAEHTDIYKIALNSENSDVNAKGMIKGFIPDNKAMCEHMGYLYSVTDFTDEYGKKVNDLYTLNNNLEPAGEATRIAEAADIKSAIFTEDKVFLTPDNLTKPIYTVDVTDPLNPRGGGTMSISDGKLLIYPYDGTHILTVSDGSEGLSLNAYDISGYDSPKLLFTEDIGKNAKSQLFNRPELFGFDNEKKLFTLPLSIISDGTLTYDGGYVYTLDLDDGFKRVAILEDATLTCTVKSGNTLYRFNNKGIYSSPINEIQNLKKIK